MGSPLAAEGQSYRGWAGTSMQAVELRPIGLDTVPFSEVVADTNGGFVYHGYDVACVAPEVCTGIVPLSEVRTVAATQDLSLTFWGFGVRGLSATTLVRARGRLGGEVFWPRSDDEFDAILGYVQLSRGAVRVRAGRQDLRSGLGFTGFDGGHVSFDRRSFHAEAYGGRSLARGLREPANEALKGLDDFLLDYGTYLMGGAVSFRNFGTLLTARYHREILSDRSGFVGERASLAVNTRAQGLRLTGSIDYDFSFQQAGKGHITVSAPLANGHWLLEVVGRRYVPYFELSTIWGFFEPVSYSEAMLRLGWSPNTTFGIRAAGGWRAYRDTQTPIVFAPLSDDGWRGDAGATWRFGSDWTIDGRYQLEWGPGAFLSSGDLSVRYQATDRLMASVTGTAFQQFEEYRLGEGKAVGFGGSLDYRFTPGAALSGGLSVLRHRDVMGGFESPWNQSRAWMSLRFDVGRDPGLANRR